MTDLLYQTDSYLREFDATVVAVDAEAGRVAETAVTYSLRLAEEYRVSPPARWHNLLIQMGFRDRGLCFHCFCFHCFLGGRCLIHRCRGFSHIGCARFGCSSLSCGRLCCGLG